jgi:hypothetical protein
MSKRDFHKEFEALRLDAIKELRDRLESIGGSCEFANDSCPVVCAYVYDHPDDFKVLSMYVNDSGHIHLHGKIVEGWTEEECITIDDMEDSHIPYIWDYIE